MTRKWAKDTGKGPEDDEEDERRRQGNDCTFKLSFFSGPLLLLILLPTGNLARTLWESAQAENRKKSSSR